MEVDVYNMQGKKVSKVELPANVFEAPVYSDLMHQAFLRQMANAHLGTHDTKTRGEVSGGGRKPWKQKGTGRARQGSTRAAQWVGGGKIFTPHPRKYTQTMPVKMRRAALRSALTVKASEDAIVVVEDLKLEEPKTRLMAAALNALVGTDGAQRKSVLLLVLSGADADEKQAQYETVMRATNNIPDAKILNTRYLNIRDLFTYDRIVMPVEAIDVLKAWLG